MDGVEFRSERVVGVIFACVVLVDVILQDLKTNSPGENTLTFNATVHTCAATDIVTPDEYRFAMFVRTAPNVDFVSLSGGDVIVQKENAGPFLHAWDPCED